jgi:L-fuconolactonase
VTALDSHLHLLFPGRFSYYWWSPGLGLPRDGYGPDEARTALDHAGVAEAIVVQAHPSIEETAHLVRIAREKPWIRGIVAWIDLRDPRIEDRLAELAAEPLVKAVRHQQGEDEPADWMLAPKVLRGLRALARTRLAWDLLCRPHHLGSAARAIARVPGLSVVLEHLGKPPVAAGALEPWATDLARLAGIPGVAAKASELLLQAARGGHASADLRPWLDVAVRCFGIDRLMGGSGWPVCLLASTCRQAFEALEPLAAPGSPARAALLGGTARRVYGIGEEHG